MVGNVNDSGKFSQLKLINIKWVSYTIQNNKALLAIHMQSACRDCACSLHASFLNYLDDYFLFFLSLMF